MLSLVIGFLILKTLAAVLSLTSWWGRMSRSCGYAFRGRICRRSVRKELWLVPAWSRVRSCTSTNLESTSFPPRAPASSRTRHPSSSNWRHLFELSVYWRSSTPFSSRSLLVRNQISRGKSSSAGIPVRWLQCKRISSLSSSQWP